MESVYTMEGGKMEKGWMERVVIIINLLGSYRRKCDD